MLWLVESIALEAAFRPLSACWNAIFYPLQNLLDILEGHITLCAKIKDESAVTSSNSRNRANLHGSRRDFLVSRGSLDCKAVIAVRQLFSIRILAIPGEIEAASLFRPQALGQHHLAGRILDGQGDRIGRTLEQRSAVGLATGKRQGIAGNHHIFADDA